LILAIQLMISAVNFQRSFDKVSTIDLYLFMGFHTKGQWNWQHIDGDVTFKAFWQLFVE